MKDKKKLIPISILYLASGILFQPVVAVLIY